MTKIGTGGALIALGLSLGCGSSSSWASYPPLTGHESLAQLKDAHDQKMTANGQKLLASWVQCADQRDAAACQWLSAYWQADYDDAGKACESGVDQRCSDAASYALQCEVRGIGSGSHRDTPEFDHENTGPRCTRDLYGVPFDLVKIPAFDVSRALTLLATSCKNGKAKDEQGQDDVISVQVSCENVAELLLSGIVAGIEIPQDFALARTVFDRGMHADGERHSDEFIASEWSKLADKYLHESPAEKRERIARVQQVYKEENAGDQELAGKWSELQNHSAFDAIAAGLSAGLATNAAVNASLANARAGIDATVAGAAAKPILLPTTTAPSAATGSSSSASAATAGTSDRSKTCAPVCSRFAACAAPYNACHRACNNTSNTENQCERACETKRRACQAAAGAVCGVQGAAPDSCCNCGM